MVADWDGELADESVGELVLCLEKKSATKQVGAKESYLVGQKAHLRDGVKVELGTRLPGWLS